MKDCGRCGKRKDASEFYVNRASEDGLTAMCRLCSAEYQKARRERLNASKPEGWKKKTEDKASYMKAWHEKHPGYMTQAKRDWWNKNRDRMRVKDALRYAIRTGKVVKLPCQECGVQEVEAHHPDYSRPLDVVWLCKEHHMGIHHA